MSRRSFTSWTLLAALALGAFCLAALAESALASWKAVAAALYGVGGALLCSALGGFPRASALRMPPIWDRLLVQGDLVLEAALLALLLNTTSAVLIGVGLLAYIVVGALLGRLARHDSSAPEQPPVHFSTFAEPTG